MKWLCGIWGVILSGGVLSLGSPPVYAWWIAWICFVPVLYIFDQKRPTGWLGFGWGVGFQILPMLYVHQWMLSLTDWVSIWVLIGVWIVFSVYQAFFSGIVFGLYSVFGYRSWMVPFLWVGFEFLRSLGPLGSTAGVVGMSQISNVVLSQYASFVTVWGLSGMIVGVNLVIYLGFKRKKKHFIFFVFMIFFVLFGLGWGMIQHNAKTLKPLFLSLALIQGNHTQDLKLNNSQAQTIMSDYTQMTRQAIEAYKPEVIVWPEMVLPYLNLEDPIWMSELQTLLQLTSTTLIMGTPIRKSYCFYNGVAFLDFRGVSNQVYYKRKLMPFGEYWPFRSALERFGFSGILGQDYSVGSGQSVFKISGQVFGILVCLDSVFPLMAKARVQNGATVPLVLSNSGWFGQSIASDLHWDMSKMRAIEARTWVIQCANTGYSGIIDPLGRVVSRSRLGERTIIYRRI